MSDVTKSGVSGLLAFQRAMATTSHNISNVDTEGYSRQRASFGARPAEFVGGFSMGTGVEVNNISRMVDDARTASVLSNSSDYNELETFAAMTGRIDNLLADKNAGLSPALQGVFDAVQQVANDPSSQTSRQVLLSEAGNMVSRFQFLESRFDELDRDVNQRMTVHIDEINQYAEALAKLNREISMKQGARGAPPNDLLDKREQLLLDLSKRVKTSTVVQDDGSINVSIGNGQSLVVGHHANKLGVTLNAFDKSRPEISFITGGGSVNITRSLSGGSLGALLEFRYDVLDKSRNQLGQLAATMATEFNEQHKLGLRFDTTPPKMGGNFFLMGEAKVHARDTNTTAGRPQVEFDPDRIGQLKGSDYSLTFNEEVNDWVLRRLNDGHTWNVDGAKELRVDGLVITLGDLSDPANPLHSGKVAHNDAFLIEPTRDTVNRFALAIDRPEQIAAATPLAAGERLNAQGQAKNSGTGRISQAVVNGAGPEPLHPGLSLVFNGSDRYDVYRDGNGQPLGSIPFDPINDVDGKQIRLPEDMIPFVPPADSDGEQAKAVGDLGGWDITFALAGVPETTANHKDEFTITTNRDGRGDNGNILRMGLLADRSTMVEGGATYQEFYSTLVGDVGSVTMRANINRDAQKTLLDQAVAAREEVSGVNLDEEAANLMRYQQAYQAAAQSVTTGNSMFQSLLDAIRR